MKVTAALVSKHFSDILPIKNGFKQGDALSPLLFNFALEYAIRRALLLASKDFEQVNADKTKYKVMSQDQNAEQSHNIKNGFNSFHRVENFKYLSSSWLSKNLKIKIYRTIILSVVLYGAKHGLSVSVNRVS